MFPVLFLRTRRTTVLTSGVAACLILMASSAGAQTGFQSRAHKDADGEHKYVIYVPPNYTPDKKWPAILFLHGAGERGTDGQAPTTVGLGPIIKRRTDFPAIVVFPQNEDPRGRILSGWSADSADGKRARTIFDSVERMYSVDPTRRILTGWSMGGYGAFHLGAADPKHWSAILPLAGGGDPAKAAALKDANLWAFAGAKDDIVRVEETRRMIDAIKQAGGHPAYTEFPDAGHDVAKLVYGDQRVIDWMLKPTKSPPPSDGGKLLAHPGERPATKPPAKSPFVPAVIVPEAISVRLGNDMLQSLAHSVPRMLSPDTLSGGIHDIFDSTVASGRQFNIQFSRIGYSGQIERAYVKAYRKDRLNIQLALRNVTMAIGTTYVTGARRSAVAGPINVVIGHRYPVWLSFDVLPYVKDQRLRLQLVGTRFDIPGDNWYVTSPAGVSTQGWGMTEEAVSSSLVNGIYAQKYRIEQEALTIIPTLLAQLETKLDLAEVSEVANAFWPLPVYRPRVKVFPRSVAVDDQGVSIVMDVAAAAVDPLRAPAHPRVASSAGITLDAVPKSPKLWLGVAPGVLEPLSRQLIEADVARIHVLDIPEKKFAAFADRARLAEAIPDLGKLPKETEIWAELVLASAIRVRDADKGSTDSRVAAKPAADDKAAPKEGPKKEDAPPQPRPFEFVVPKAVISLATRESPSAKWTPYADVEFELVQKAIASTAKPDFAHRDLRIDWQGEPALETRVRFAGGNAAEKEVRTDRLRELFLEAWKGWTGSGPASDVAVPDVDFGYSKLRMADVEWQPPVLAVAFERPGVKISNSSKQKLVYETKGPYSGWSPAITLEPGQSHAFDIAYPLSFRRKEGDRYVQMFTLPVGSHSDYRDVRGNLNLYLVRGDRPGK